MRGYDYYQFSGTNAVFGNVELRFPLIEAMLTPIGVLGGVRGVAFFNIGAGWFPGQDFTFWTSSTETYQQQIADGRSTRTATSSAIYAPPVHGQRLPPAGRQGVVRDRRRDVRAGPADALRLGVADDVQRGLGGRLPGSGGRDGMAQVRGFQFWIGFDL